MAGDDEPGDDGATADQTDGVSQTGDERAPPTHGDEGSRGVTLDGIDAEDDEEEAFGAAYGGRGPADRNPEEVLQRPDASSAALQNLTRSDLREHYGPIRTWFKQREASYKPFQRRLTQAWLRDTYDQYLARTVALTLAIAVVGVVLGAAAGGGLVGAARYGYLPPWVVRRTGLSLRVLALGTGGLFALAGLVGAGLYWVWRRVYRIRSRVARRRREIAYNLPYAVTFMYALSRAGVSFDRIIARLADSTDTYGAVAQEFDRVVRDVEMFGNNLYIGLENLRAVTPNEELRRLTDDVMTVLETGGDLAAFLRDEVDDQLETAIAEQEAYIERLELLSEVFVVGLVAAPLFVLVVLMVISFLGARTLPVLVAFVYGLVPLSLAGFAVLVDSLSRPFAPPRTTLSTAEADHGPPSPENAPGWHAAYERSKRLTGLRNRIRAQVGRTREEPWRAFLFSVPLAVALPVAGVLTGVVPFSLAALLARPVELTVELAVAPLVVATVPVAVGYEYRRYRELALQQRFPDLLELLATSNRRGLSLARSLEIVTESTAGRLGEELRLLRNDIRWNADVPAAFEALGDRLVSPTLTRSVELVAEGSRATSDLHAVLDVAATDTAERVRLARERRQTLGSYVAIVAIGFLVYLLVVLLLSTSFLEPLEAFARDTEAVSGPISPGAVPVTRLRVLLFHSALIQGFGSGLLAGKLTENSLYGGLKYGVALVLLATAAFTIV